MSNSLLIVAGNGYTPSPEELQTLSELGHLPDIANDVRGMTAKTWNSKSEARDAKNGIFRVLSRVLTGLESASKSCRLIRVDVLDAEYLVVTLEFQTAEQTEAAVAQLDAIQSGVVQTKDDPRKRRLSLLLLALFCLVCLVLDVAHIHEHDWAMEIVSSPPVLAGLILPGAVLLGLASVVHRNEWRRNQEREKQRKKAEELRTSERSRILAKQLLSYSRRFDENNRCCECGTSLSVSLNSLAFFGAANETPPAQPADFCDNCRNYLIETRPKTALRMAEYPAPDFCWFCADLPPNPADPAFKASVLVSVSLRDESHRSVKTARASQIVEVARCRKCALSHLCFYIYVGGHAFLPLPRPSSLGLFGEVTLISWVFSLVAPPRHSYLDSTFTIGR